MTRSVVDSVRDKMSANCFADLEFTRCFRTIRELDTFLVAAPQKVAAVEWYECLCHVRRYCVAAAFRTLPFYYGGGRAVEHYIQANLLDLLEPKLARFLVEQDLVNAVEIVGIGYS